MTKLFLNKVIDVTFTKNGEKFTEKFFVSEDEFGEYIEMFEDSSMKEKMKIYLSEYNKNDIL